MRVVRCCLNIHNATTDMMKLFTKKRYASPRLSTTSAYFTICFVVMTKIYIGPGKLFQFFIYQKILILLAQKNTIVVAYTDPPTGYTIEV